eukprot:Nk52_evm5s578 gene=Nk52_evmTU5s578
MALNPENKGNDNNNSSKEDVDASVNKEIKEPEEEEEEEEEANKVSKEEEKNNITGAAEGAVSVNDITVQSDSLPQKGGVGDKIKDTGKSCSTGPCGANSGNNNISNNDNGTSTGVIDEHEHRRVKIKGYHHLRRQSTEGLQLYGVLGLKEIQMELKQGSKGKRKQESKKEQKKKTREEEEHDSKGDDGKNIGGGNGDQPTNNTTSTSRIADRIDPITIMTACEDTIAKIHREHTKSPSELGANNGLTGNQIGDALSGDLTEQGKEMMSDVMYAKRILLDAKKRKIYDQYGMEGIATYEQFGSLEFKVRMMIAKPMCKPICAVLFLATGCCFCFCCFKCFNGCCNKCSPKAKYYFESDHYGEKIHKEQEIFMDEDDGELTDRALAARNETTPNGDQQETIEMQPQATTIP